jgi:hypothetical protein
VEICLYYLQFFAPPAVVFILYLIICALLLAVDAGSLRGIIIFVSYKPDFQLITSACAAYNFSLAWEKMT